MGGLTLTISSLGGLNEMWASIIGLFSFIPNFGWMLILFTFCLKLLLSPLDFWQRMVSGNSAKKQAILQPEIAKIKKQYANNKQMENQKTMELYKRENYNIMGSCLGMLVNMALTLFIFISLFYSLIAMSHTQIANQYDELKVEYEVVYTAYITDNAVDVDNPTEGEIALAVETAQGAVVLKYDKIKDSWLWVKNVWRSDTYVSPFPNFDEYRGMVGLSAQGDTQAEKDAWLAAQKAEYNTITQGIRDGYAGQWNGYLILVVLAAGVTFASVVVTQSMANKSKKKKDAVSAALDVNKKDPKNPNAQVNPTAGAMKIMKFILPLVMVFFAFTYSAAFTLYIITNSLCAALFGILWNIILDKIDAKKETKAIVSNKADYSR